MRSITLRWNVFVPARRQAIVIFSESQVLSSSVLAFTWFILTCRRYCELLAGGYLISVELIVGSLREVLQRFQCEPSELFQRHQSCLLVGLLILARVLLSHLKDQLARVLVWSTISTAVHGTGVLVGDDVVEIVKVFVEVSALIVFSA